MMDFDALLTLSTNGKTFANPRRVALLKAVHTTGSISQGAKQAGISYKAAFDAIKDMNSRSQEPLVTSEKGGKGGGGASLTHFGERLVQMYELLDKIQDMGLKALNDENAPLHSLLGIMSKFSLQTSARNQLFGTICDIQRYELHDLVIIQLAGKHRISATITHGSTVRLQLAIGKDVVALIKGPSITVFNEPASNLDYDNQLKGTIKAINRDNTSAEITVGLSEYDEICALVDNDNLIKTNTNINASIYACFHSTQVIIATMC